MGFKEFTPAMVVTGSIGKIAKHTTGVLGTDPVNMAALISNTTYIWNNTNNWKNLGATEGGINMTHGFATTGYKVDQSDGDFRKVVTDNTYKIATQLAHVGDLAIFEEAWLAGPTTTVVVTTVERIKGLSAVRAVPRKSLAVATLDNSVAPVLRVYYFREAELDSGDSQLSLTEDGMQVLPVTWTAFPSTSATAEREFGFIIEDNGFGGVMNP